MAARCDLVTRSRTSFFMQARRERKGCGKIGGIRSRGKTAPLNDCLLGDGGMQKETIIEMRPLPPQWVETAEDVREDLNEIKANLTRLAKAQQKKLLNVFDKDDQSGRESEFVCAEIAKLIRQCECNIRQVTSEGIGHAKRPDLDTAIQENAQQNLATQLQKLSHQFRQAQKEYLEEIRKRQRICTWDHGLSSESRECGSVVDFNEGQAQEVERMEITATERSEEICRVASSISELHTIFKELAVLVIDQGSVMDRIDYNIEDSLDQTKKAKKIIVAIDKKQKNSRAGCCLLALVIMNAMLILVLILKARR